jgi:transcriptional antiterminator NusG
MGEQEGPAAGDAAPKAAGAEGAPKPQWYTVRCQISREESVRDNLNARIKALKLEERITDVLIPTEQVTEIRSGRKQVRARKKFAGYILVRMILDDETYLVVRETPGMGDVPSKFPMPDHEVQRILMEQFQAQEERPKIKIDFTKGDTVRVKEGAFENFEGIVEEIDDQKGRIKVGLTIFGRATSTDLEYWQVEKV